VRTDVLLGGEGTYKIFNLNATLTNLTPKNNYSVKVACTKRNLNAGTLGIGTAVNTTFLNSEMSQSVLTTSVLQPY
jgi:DhnA family fructose-bisphosphate aldolase class Ia